MISLKDFNFLSHISSVNLRDFSDTLNCIITVGLLAVLSSVVSLKSYVISPIQCYSPTTPVSEGYEAFIQAYCWAHGTINLLNENTPHTETEWNDPSIQRISYYQWIPFLLLLQCGLFYLPNLIWTVFCHHNHGVDLTNIIRKSFDLANDITNSEKCCQIVFSLEDIFFVHRDFRRDPMSQLKRKIHKRCKFLIVSKRLATKMSINYIFVKLLYLINGVLQLYVINSIISMDSSFIKSYWRIFEAVISGKSISKYFPRMSFCQVKDMRSVGIKDNYYVAQCVLSVNMLNEKIFIFLYFWYSIVFFVTFFSLCIWLFQLGRKNNQINVIKKYLKMRNNFEKVDKMMIEKFVLHFLRIDGIFLLYMIRSRAGDVVVSAIANGLYKTFHQKYRNQNFGNDKPLDEVENLSLKLERGGKGSVKIKLNNATAPKNEYIL